MFDYHPVINVLVQKYKLPQESLNAIKDQLKEHRMQPMAIKDLLLKYKLTQESVFQKAIAEFYELEYREHFEEIEISREFTDTIPIRYAKKFIFFPLRKDGFDLEVAVEDPSNFHPLDDLGRQFKCRIIPVVSHHQAIMDLINRAYDRNSGMADQVVDSLGKEESFESILGIDEPEDLLDATDEEPIKRLVNSIMWQAAKDEASDIHIGPTPKDSTVRFRIDGVLHLVTSFPRQAHVTVVNRIKVMSRLDIAQKGMPQDGRTMVLIAGRKVDIRVSTVPTVYGEKIVLRLLYQSDGLKPLSELGLSENILKYYNKFIHKNAGIILVTGPTGSGKTTTLYASLAQIDSNAKNVITIEDPVEYKMSGYSQIEINHKLGLSFAMALRSVLRQDPDVVMVGEMRDAETAQIAIQAALTGHLVFSTLHTNSAPATITRLIDMGIEPFLVSSTVLAVLAQRLVRRICEYCKETYDPHPEQLREVGISDEQLAAAGGKLYHGTGCSECRHTGYRGRVGIHELLMMNDKVKTAILDTSDANVIKRVGIEHGMISLRMNGCDKILLGLTTVEEILAITAED
ncbi:MAG: Flp pilus assembly complex ATPase component TadA [SAR324 cluster bacterium]|nr:Flp pilus assembly complex ATPase component TadA [SAR324 cluster bacterium]